jgi:hypothetical protein
MLKIFLTVLSMIFLLQGAALATEFSADTLMTYEGGQKITGKIYFKPDMFRMDMKDMEDMTVITRIDKKVMWNIMRGEKMYMEMPLDLSNKPKIEEKFEGELERKEVGKETVNGHPTTKYLITYKVDKKKEQVYQWVATDINFPVKTAAVDGSWTQEFKNIKLGPQQQSLFEVPAGYNKMQMPKMPGGMDFMHMK